MDAANYLKRQGWRGDGHSLDHTGRGIRKPLLVSKKVDVLGVGVNKHAAVSDQWWMRAFDQGLKDLGTGKRSALADVREKGMAYGGLYGRFVRGEGVAGTFDEMSEEENSRKRKREDVQDITEERQKKVKTDTGSIQKDLARNVRSFVNEAIQLGLISEDADNHAGRKSANSMASVKYGEKAVAKVFKEAGLQGVKKQDKYSRGKLERAVKRAAKEYLLSQMSPEERKAIDSADLKENRKAKRRESNADNNKKDAERARAKAEEDAERARAKAEKALKKQAKREKRQAAGDKIESNADEIKLSGTTNSKPKTKTKTIPRVGPVDRYPTKAEKKAKKLQSQKDKTTTPTTTSKENAPSPTATALTFTIDTHGDAGLKTSTSATTTLSVIDSTGQIRYTCQPNQPVPLDPTIWKGIKPKLLPRPVRQARTEYMSAKREARKVRKAEKGKAKMAGRMSG